MDGRIAVYEEYAKILINGGLSATKLLEVHLTEIDFLDCTSTLYNYVIDPSTGRPFPAADGRWGLRPTRSSRCARLRGL